MLDSEQCQLVLPKRKESRRWGLYDEVSAENVIVKSFHGKDYGEGHLLAKMSHALTFI